MDRDAIQRFSERFMQMTTGAAVLAIVALGDKTGLFREMKGAGPLTLDELTARTGLQRRYLEEALGSLAAAEIVRYDAANETFELPEEHAVCLADESSPYFMAGWSQMIPAIYGAIPGVTRAFREGGGVPYSDFGPDMVEAIDRSNSPGMRILLTRRWLPAMPDVVERLEQGIRVADVGCGGGTSSITMAKAYPRSTIIGYEPDATSCERARTAAKAAGLENLHFEQKPAQALPSEPTFDLITTFDVIHDMADPRGALRSIRAALEDDGSYLMVEPAAGETLADNLHPGGALLYAISTLHCMTISLAHDGEGLGTAWGPAKAESFCRDAGFTRFERLDVDNPFNAFYRVRP